MAVCAIACLSPAFAQNQEAASAASVPANSEAVEPASNGSADVSTPEALPPSIFRTTGASRPSLRDSSNYGEPWSLSNVETHTQFGGVGIPFLSRSFEPKDAHLKLGPLYFRFTSVSASILHSDNVDLQETNREGGWLAITQLEGVIIAQLTEGLQLAVAGTLVYLPLESRAGILTQASGLVSPAMHTQISWKTEILGWPVIFADDFSVGTGSYSGGTRNNFAIFGDPEPDRTHRVFHQQATFNESTSSLNSPSERDFLYFSNIVSAATVKMLPNEVLLQARVVHENLWYNSDGRGLPALRDEATVEASWQRENLRFKPFIEYDVARTDQTPGINQTIRMGVRGPITDQLDFAGNVGMFIPSGGQGASPVWGLGLYHVAGPYTTEDLLYQREATEFQDEIVQSVQYHLRQVLGPTLFGDFYVGYGITDSIFDALQTHQNELLAGLRLTYTPSPRTQFRLGVVYNRISGYGSAEVWTGRLEVNRYISDTVSLQLAYQYQQRESDVPNDSYYENLFIFTLSKYFY